MSTPKDNGSPHQGESAQPPPLQAFNLIPAKLVSCLVSTPKGLIVHMHDGQVLQFQNFDLVGVAQTKDAHAGASGGNIVIPKMDVRIKGDLRGGPPHG